MARRAAAQRPTNGPAGLIDVQIIGDSRDVDARLMGMYEAFSPLAIGAWLVAGVDPILRRRTSERFESEGDDIVGKWESLKPATVEIRKSKHFPGEHPINVRTGQMKRHLLDAPPRLAVHGLGATMWSPGEPTGKTAKKIQTAQMGDAASNTPPRPVLGVGVADLEAVLISLSIHIASKQPGVGGNASRIPISRI